MSSRDWELSISISNSARLHLCLSLPVNQFTPHRFSLLSSLLPSRFLAQPSVSFSPSLLLFCEHPFDVGVHRTAHTRFYFYAMSGAVGREVGDSGGGVNEDEDCHSPHRRLPPFLSFPGGLYGWKWGVLSATSLAQTVPSALSEDQPERGETNNHRHRGSVPYRKATHSPWVPHGELQPALQFCCCLPSLWRIAARSGGGISVALSLRYALFVCRAASSKPVVFLLWILAENECVHSVWCPLLTLGCSWCTVLTYFLEKVALVFIECTSSLFFSLPLLLVEFNYFKFLGKIE